MSNILHIEKAREKREKERAEREADPRHWSRVDALSGLGDVSSYLQKKKEASENRRKDNEHVLRVFRIPIPEEGK